MLPTTSVGVPSLNLAAATAASMPRSEIRDVMDLAWEIGEDVLRLEVGEPNFPTPAHAVEAAAQAARDGHTKYLPNAGLPALRAALADKLRTRNGLPVSAEQVVITNGAVQALYASLALTADPGDEVLLPDPAWPNFRMQAHLLGLRAVPYRLRSENKFLPDLAEIRSLVGPRTRAILVNSPSNPLGTVIPASVAQGIVDLAERNGFWVIADEVYDELVFDDSFVSVASAAPSEHVISLYSFSKVYAMTGWRVGYAALPSGSARVLTAMQEPLVSCINAPAQFAALAAVSGPQAGVDEMRTAYRRRRDLLLEELASRGLRAHVPAGAFYVWVDVGDRSLFGAELARRLLEEEHVAVAPGTAFGEEGRTAVRLSLATAEDHLVEGARRLSRFLSRIRERA